MAELHTAAAVVVLGSTYTQHALLVFVLAAAAAVVVLTQHTHTHIIEREAVCI
jgi:hypothetical protein